MKNKVKVYGLSAICLAILLTALRTSALLTAYDPTVGYFDDALLPLLMNALYIASAIWCITPLILIPKNILTCPDTQNPFCTAAEFAASAAFFVCGISISVGASKLVLAIGLLMLVSTFYFLSEMISTPTARKGRGWLGFLPVACLLTMLFDIYFDMFVPINSPHKIAIQLSILTTLALLLCEIREHIGKAAPRAALAARLLCLITTLPTAIGNLIFYGVPHDRFAGNVITPLYALPLLAVGLYAASRLLFVGDTKHEAKEIAEISENLQEPIDKPSET